MLSGVDGSAGGCWRCCWRCCWPPGVLPVSLNCPLPLRRTHSPALFSKLLFFCFCSDGSNQHKIWAAGGESVFIWEAGWEEPSGNNSTFGCFRNLEIFLVIRSLLPISMETTHDPKEPVLLIAFKIMRHAKLCLSVIMFLICVCWHPERMCRALSTCGQGASLTC